jgi:phosphatidylinositol phospholipase C delta
MSLDSKIHSAPEMPTVQSLPQVITNEALTPTPSGSVTETGMGDVTVPQLLQQGTPMTKVSAKERKRAVFRLDPDIGQIIWESKKHRIR